MERNNSQISNKNMLQRIVKTECGCRLCKCGDNNCEFAADFFDTDGTPTAAFGNDEDLLQNQNLEAAQDYTEYAMRVGMSGDGRVVPEIDVSVLNGEPVYSNTASYRMISTDDTDVDSSKS